MKREEPRIPHLDERGARQQEPAKSRLNCGSRECEGDDGEQEEEAQRDAQLGHHPLCRGAVDLHATSHIDTPRTSEPYTNAGCGVVVPSRRDGLEA